MRRTFSIAYSFYYRTRKLSTENFCFSKKIALYNGKLYWYNIICRWNTGSKWRRSSAGRRPGSVIVPLFPGPNSFAGTRFTSHFLLPNFILGGVAQSGRASYPQSRPTAFSALHNASSENCIFSIIWGRSSAGRAYGSHP